MQVVFSVYNVHGFQCSCGHTSPALLQVNYDEKHAKGRDDASDYSAQSDVSGEESGDDATHDKRASKVCSARPLLRISQVDALKLVSTSKHYAAT